MARIQEPRREWFVRPAPGTVRVHLDHLRDPLGHFDLSAMDAELREDVAVAKEGHSAVTLVKYPDLRVVLIALRKGARVDEASTEARISLQTLRGHLRLRLPEGNLDMPAGHLATLEGMMEFGVEAVTDGALLLTLSWPHGAT